MIVDCVSDLHGAYPKLDGGDLLIIAGDLTARDASDEYDDFCSWLCVQNYRRKIVISGNHDNRLWEEQVESIHNTSYLKDSGTEFEGLKIWGSPWTLFFDGMNPDCCAFTCKYPDEMRQKWEMIHKDTDILITHSPPKGILDQTSRKYRVGCDFLREKVREIRPKLHVFGHIHEGYGKLAHNYSTVIPLEERYTLFVNASHMNVDYKPVNAPIRVIL